METFFRDIELYNEAWKIEHNIQGPRKFTHAELEPAMKAIREIEAARHAEAAKLKVPTNAQIDAAMMEIIGPNVTTSAVGGKVVT